MGDMADYCNEMLEYDDYLREDWRSGRISDEEAYDAGIIDEWGSEYEV